MQLIHPHPSYLYQHYTLLLLTPDHSVQKYQ